MKKLIYSSKNRDTRWQYEEITTEECENDEVTKFLQKLSNREKNKFDQNIRKTHTSVLKTTA